MNNSFLFPIPGSLNNRKCLKIQSKDLTDEVLKTYLFDLDEQIQQIYLTSNRITSKGIQYISQYNFCHLTQLILNKNDLGNAGCKMICKANWPELQYLSLNQNRIDSQGIGHLAKGEFKKLTILVLMRNNIGIDGIKRFNKGGFFNLQSLSLTDKFVNPRDADIRNKIDYWDAVNFVQIQFLKLRLIWLNCSTLTNQNINELKSIMKHKMPSSTFMMR